MVEMQGNRGVRLGGRAEGSGRVTDLERVLHKHAAPFWIATRRPTVRALPASLGCLSTCFQQPQLGLHLLPTASTRPPLEPTDQVFPQDLVPRPYILLTDLIPRTYSYLSLKGN